MRYSELNRKNGYIAARDNITGEMMAVPEDMASEYGLPGAGSGPMSSASGGGGGYDYSGYNPNSRSFQALQAQEKAKGAPVPEVPKPAAAQPDLYRVDEGDPAVQGPQVGVVVRRTKGGMTPNTQSTKGITVDQQQDLISNEDATYNAELEAIKSRYLAEKSEYESQVAHSQVAQAEAKQKATRIAMEDQARQILADRRKAKVEDNLKAVRERKITPWTEEAGIGEAFLAALARAAGAYSAGMLGGPNHAGQLLDNMIERDIMLKQQKKADDTDQALDERERAYREIGLDQDTKLDLYRAARNEDFAARAQEVLATKELKFLHPAAQQALVDAARKSNEFRGKIFEKIQNEETQKYVAPSTSLEFDLPTQIELKKAEAQHKLDTLSGKGTEVRAGGQVIGSIKDDTDRRAMQDAADKVEVINNITAKLLESHQNGKVLSAEERATFKSNILQLAKRYRESGESSDSDMANNLEMLGGDGMDLFSNAGRAGLKAAQQTANEQLRIKARNRGLAAPSAPTRKPIPSR